MKFSTQEKNSENNNQVKNSQHRNSKGEQGVKGETGTTGLKGERGKEGKQGKQGEQGLPGINGSDGSQGLQGPQGPKGDTGSANSITLDTRFAYPVNSPRIAAAPSWLEVETTLDAIGPVGEKKDSISIASTKVLQGIATVQMVLEGTTPSTASGFACTIDANKDDAANPGYANSIWYKELASATTLFSNRSVPTDLLEMQISIVGGAVFEAGTYYFNVNCQQSPEIPAYITRVNVLVFEQN